MNQNHPTQPNSELLELEQLLSEAERRKKYNKLAHAFPEKGPFKRDLYPHALQFFSAGNKFRERCFIAANRIGKTYAGATEMSFHLTGLYPDWWTGKRFREPIRAWCAGKTNETTKEIIQYNLFGSFLDIGTGLIPKENIVKVTNRSNCPETIQTAYVKHYTDGIYDGDSVVGLKSYDMGPDKFQGTSMHAIWLDEEPDNEKIKGECSLRLMKTSDFPGGILIFTFTPLFGLSKTVLEFCPGGRVPRDHINPETGTWAIQVTWDDVPHLSTEEKEEMLKHIPPWLRDARTKGIPQIGAGAIYPVSESDITVQPFKIPEYWEKVYALDVGWHKTAAAWFAKDPSDGVWYLYSEHYQGRDEPPIHAQAIQSRGKWIPGVIDPASNRTRDDGSRLLEQYIDLGLDLTMADNSVEAGIAKTWQMLACGDLKIFSVCQNWLNEYRCYHKDEKGKIPDGQPDHLMDATRYFANTGQYVSRVSPDDEDEDSQNAFFSNRRSLGASETTGY